jgi:4-amino-4-deoxy-L-arabinose transferase-like glycosyltransferase
MLSHGLLSWLRVHAHEGKVALFLILASALVLRLFWVLHAQTQPVEIADPQWYWAVASNLAAGHGFTVRIVGNEWAAGSGGNPTTLWPPGWPLSLTALFVIFGTGLTVAKLLNVVAGVVTVYLAYRVGELSFGRRIGLIGAAILAFYPNHIIWSSTLYADVYFTMWFSLAVFLMLRAREWLGRRAIVGWVLLGLIIGVASLTRGQGLMLPLFAFALWAISFGWQRALGRTVIVCGAAALVILPWTVRNAATFHALIPISVNDGFNLYIGHNPDATGRFVAPVELWQMEPGISYTEREVLFSREGRRLAIEYALDHPAREIELSLKKLYYQVIPDSDAIDWADYGTRVGPSGTRTALIWLSDGYYWALLFVAIVGLASFRRLAVVRWIAFVVVAWGAFHILFFSEPRFHTPLLPLVALLAALGIEGVRRFAADSPQPSRKKSRRERRLQLASERRGGRRR